MSKPDGLDGVTPEVERELERATTMEIVNELCWRNKAVAVVIVTHDENIVVYGPTDRLEMFRLLTAGQLEGLRSRKPCSD